MAETLVKVTAGNGLVQVLLPGVDRVVWNAAWCGWVWRADILLGPETTSTDVCEHEVWLVLESGWYRYP